MLQSQERQRDPHLSQLYRHPLSASQLNNVFSSFPSVYKIIPAAGAQGPGLSPEAAQVIQPRLAASGVSHQLGEAGAPEDAGREVGSEVIRGRGAEARQLRLREGGQDGEPDNS